MAAAAAALYEWRERKKCMHMEERKGEGKTLQRPPKGQARERRCRPAGWMGGWLAGCA